MPAGNLKLYEKKKTKKIGIRFRRKKNWKNTRSFFFFAPNEKESQVKLKIISEG